MHTYAEILEFRVKVFQRSERDRKREKETERKRKRWTDQRFLAPHLQRCGLSLLPF